MQISFLRNSAIASSLLLSTQAFPVFFNILSKIEERNAASYSVVAVDGGSPTTAAPAATVTNISIQSQPPTTFTVTSLSATTIVETPSPVTSVVTATPDNPTPTMSVTQPVTSSAPARTQDAVTVYLSPEVSSTTYDDGMWHTTYFKPVTTAEVTVSTAAPIATDYRYAAAAAASTSRSNWGFGGWVQ